MRAPYILFYCSLISGGLSATTLYKVVKPDGSVIYTDKPVAGAVKVDLTQGNFATMPAIITPKPPTTIRPEATTKKQPDYQLDLISPVDEHIRNNAGNLSIQVKLTPAAPGEYQLFLDGKLFKRQPSPLFQLTNIDRGEHHYQIKFLDTSGKILALSPSRVFYLHRASVLNRAN